MSTGASTPAARGQESSTLRGFVARHKLVSLGVAGIIALMLVTTIAAILGPKGGAVRDSTTCSQWGSANQTKQAAYARLYVKEHGPLRGGKASPADVIVAINNGCARAFGEDVSDTVTVTQAISGKF